MNAQLLNNETLEKLLEVLLSGAYAGESKPLIDQMVIQWEGGVLPIPISRN